MAKRIKVNSLARPLAFPRKMRSSIAIAKESDMKHLLMATAAIALLAPAAASVAIREKPVKESDSVVVMETSLGKIKIELFRDKAPLTVKNFLQYVDGKFYDGTIFHRVIPNFMIQGGGFKPGLMEKKSRDPIKNEAGNGLSNLRGNIAVARTTVPNSGTCQFFINVQDNKFLDKSKDSDGYCVFGKVIAGMDVVDKIKAVATGDRGGHQNVPQSDVLIKSVRRDKK
jgi:cyclophilin family peptidyl-prolyl cis-trans isomerase